MSEELFRYKREIDYIKDSVGFDTERNLIKIAIVKQDLALLEAIARTYVWDEDTDKWAVQTKSMVSGELVNIKKFGGTTLTGRDISLDLAKLDIALSALRDALRGLDTRNFSTLQSVVSKEDSGETVTIANNEDASGGKTATLKNFKIFTLYLTVTAACTITVELSPDGTTWFEEPSSPYVFGAAGTQFINLPYAATAIKVTSTTADPITAIGRGVL